MPPNSNSLVKEVFKTRSAPRKKISTIFSQMFPAPDALIQKDTSSGGKRMDLYPAAVEWGSNSIKLIQLAKSTRGPEIAKAVYFPLGRPLPPAAEIRNLVVKILKDQQIKSQAAMTLPLSQIRTFTFVLPFMPEEEIEQAVLWKLKQTLPQEMASETVTFDFVPCFPKTGGASREIKVLVFLADKGRILELMKFFQSHGLKLLAVEPESYSVFTSLLWAQKLGVQETSLLLHLGAGESSLTVMHSQQPYWMKPLGFSGNALTDAIAASRQMDWQKAEMFKKQEGLNSWKPGASAGAGPEAAILSQLENLVVDVEHAFRTFTQQIGKTEINGFQKVILSGGTAGLPNLEKFFADRLDVPVEIHDPFESLPEVSGQGASSVIKDNPGRFASVLGLAVRFLEW